MSETLEQLLRSTLVMVAHPDDESIGCGILLQRMARAAILVCTDGAPERPLSWPRRVAQYRRWQAARRRWEFRSAASVAGVETADMMTGIRDRTLHLSLNAAARALAGAVRKQRPAAILTHAFEGGHPDHDSCAFLARWAGTEFSLPVWEMPLYYRPSPDAPLTYQQFLHPGGNEVALSPRPDELRRKQRMLSKHRSQAAVISEFDYTREVFRPQPDYNFTASPNPALSTFAVCEQVSIETVLASLRAFRPARELSVR